MEWSYRDETSKIFSDLKKDEFFKEAGIQVTPIFAHAMSVSSMGHAVLKLIQETPEFKNSTMAQYIEDSCKLITALLPELCNKEFALEFMNNYMEFSDLDGHES